MQEQMYKQARGGKGEFSKSYSQDLLYWFETCSEGIDSFFSTTGAQMTKSKEILQAGPHK